MYDPTLPFQMRDGTVIQTPQELAKLRHRENPKKEPSGIFTGRCGCCGSKDLWDDCTMYGCNVCGAMFSN